jgi:hypothetical protein
MAELLSISILEKKRDDIEAYIATLTRQIAQARKDLGHVNATIRLFDLDGTTKPKVYVNLTRLFEHGELLRLAIACLAAMPDGVADTRQIAAYAMREKGWDATDKPLLLSLTNRVTHALTEAVYRGKLERAGKRNGVNVWRST